MEKFLKYISSFCLSILHKVIFNSIKYIFFKDQFHLVNFIKFSKGILLMVHNKLQNH